MFKGIIIIGASGAGTTTIGKALAEYFGYSFFDIDDYFWEDSHIPFTIKRDKEERIMLLKNDLFKTNGFVMSGSICGWEDEFIPLLDLVVFVETEVDIRIERIKRREAERFGDRVKKGGDMYKEHLDFIEWAKTYDTAGLDQRSKVLHEQWIMKLDCSILRVDGTKTVENIIKQFTEVM